MPSSVLTVYLFLSTPSSRRATRAFHRLPGDQRDFYPRPPRGGRQMELAYDLISEVFLSTPSSRRATPTSTAPAPGMSNFYPRPPRGGRPPAIYWRHRRFFISIHALLAEGDLDHAGIDRNHQVFLSTPSSRRATRHAAFNGLLGCIFLSTPSSRRATLGFRTFWSCELVFLSTPSSRRATSCQKESAKNI